MPHSHDHQGHGSKHYDRAFAIGIALNLGFVLVEAFYGWHLLVHAYLFVLFLGWGWHVSEPTAAVDWLCVTACVLRRHWLTGSDRSGWCCD